MGIIPVLTDALPIPKLFHFNSKEHPNQSKESGLWMLYCELMQGVVTRSSNFYFSV